MSDTACDHLKEAREHLGAAAKAAFRHWMPPEVERELRAAARSGVQAAQERLKAWEARLADEPAPPPAT
ncbi:MAG: hypothetical protein RLZZ127_1986 [Planctomycetota bacterium]|jgi:hypothetical protein